MCCRSGLLFIFLFVSRPLISQDINIPSDQFYYSSLERYAFENLGNETCDPLVFLLANNRLIDSTFYHRIKAELTLYSLELEARRTKVKSDLTYLSYVFHRIHKKYLRNYDYPGAFTGIFNKGRYNCVTGAALYASVLEQLGYTYQLYETRFHVFLTVRSRDARQVMYETTDPLNGFISNENEIQKRINAYLENERLQLEKTEALTPPFDTKPLLNKITLRELAGLHYYNLAVSAINKCDSVAAKNALLKAQILYPQSVRIQHLLDYATLTATPAYKFSHN